MTDRTEVTVRLDLDELARFKAAKSFCEGEGTYLPDAFAKLLMLAAIEEIETIRNERIVQNELAPAGA